MFDSIEEEVKYVMEEHSEILAEKETTAEDITAAITLLRDLKEYIKTLPSSGVVDGVENALSLVKAVEDMIHDGVLVRVDDLILPPTLSQEQRMFWGLSSVAIIGIVLEEYQKRNTISKNVLLELLKALID